MTVHPDAVVLETALLADPPALRARLGSDAPVHRVVLPDGMPSWLVTGNDAIRQALNDPRIVRDAAAAAPGLREHLGLASDDFVLTRHMLFADPPDHTRLRRLVSRAFTARRIERLRPRVTELAHGLIDAFAGRGRADLVASLALPLPVAVISELLGVPAADRARFERRAEIITGAGTSSDAAELAAAGQWFDCYLIDLVERRRREPGDDMISAMLAVQEQDDRLTDVEVRSNAFLLLAAGFETSVNLIANGVLALLRHPGQLAGLRADRGLMRSAVEELLRYDSPVSSITYRFARERTSIAGTVIEAGEHIALSPPCGNHDTAKFTAPERLDLRRRGNAHVGFGHGIHFCLGAPLARLEGEVVFGAVLDRLPGLALAVPAEELTWKETFIVHRLDSLPVTFTPARPASGHRPEAALHDAVSG
ncbi:cytochrome P450 family protein [Actinomadura verrucosospora]|uniref:Cytochrome P450 n=1 Tax=Actinomadura verrucosospora TaxID=46165 RepID=A0A7D3VVH4_ACTVE|nr:cytochrome P450 [Actinomadura verrucosospora]QKG19911.1 cytochrome P450 [Actinomadura verrucosospora]